MAFTPKLPRKFTDKDAMPSNSDAIKLWTAIQACLPFERQLNSRSIIPPMEVQVHGSMLTNTVSTRAPGTPSLDEVAADLTYEEGENVFDVMSQTGSDVVSLTRDEKDLKTILVFRRKGSRGKDYVWAAKLTGADDGNVDWAIRSYSNSGLPTLATQDAVDEFLAFAAEHTARIDVSITKAKALLGMT